LVDEKRHFWEKSIFTYAKKNEKKVKKHEKTPFFARFRPISGRESPVLRPKSALFGPFSGKWPKTAEK